MTGKDRKAKIDTAANEILQTKIEASIHSVRSIVESWLPEPVENEVGNDEHALQSYTKSRPDRLGLGAKYLSHSEAMQGSIQTKEGMRLKNRILNQNRRVSQRNENVPSKTKGMSDSEEEDESKAKHDKGGLDKRKMPQGDFLSTYLDERKRKKKKR